MRVRVRVSVRVRVRADQKVGSARLGWEIHGEVDGEI